jgi:hypothetical protein
MNIAPPRNQALYDASITRNIDALRDSVRRFVDAGFRALRMSIAATNSHRHVAAQAGRHGSARHHPSLNSAAAWAI